MGVVPFGLIYGVLARDAGLGAIEAQSMSFIVFAGSAQFIMARLLAEQTPAAIVILTAFLVNLRHILYSASMSPFLSQLRPRWQWALAYLLTDESYAVAILRYSDEGQLRQKHWYFFGAGLALLDHLANQLTIGYRSRRPDTRQLVT